MPLLLACACMNDDDYSLSRSDALTFSTDTVAFDTIISGVPTNTYTFTVYNKAKKALRIPQVRLEGGAASPFKVNVDGTALSDGSATDFEIAAEDSMIVYLMANVPETDSDEPVPSSDNLVFTTEAGVEQKVALTASGQAVETLTGVRIASDTTLHLSRPFRVMDSLVVEAGATLTLSAGTRMYFHPKASLIVHGTLFINGTLENPVVLRGDRMGNMFAGQPYDRIPGQWGGVELCGESYGNWFTYADIHSGSYGIKADSSDVSQTKLVLENCIVHNTTNRALDIRMANVYAGNCQITNAGGDCVRVRGGSATFVHCTIARFFVFTGGDGVALDFANYDGQTRLPLTKMLVANSVITGYQSDEIMGNNNPDHEDDAYNYYFTNCLINTTKNEKEDQRIVNCIYDTDDGTTNAEGDIVVREKNFTPDFDTHLLTFSFELSPYSKAIGTGDAEVTSLTYPTDRMGRPRGDKPDMGCLQHLEQQANP